MAMVVNPQTGQLEDDGQDVATPGVTGAPIVKTATNSSTTTTAPKVTPGFMAAKGELDKLGPQTVSQVQDENQVRMDLAQSKADAAKAEAAQAAVHAAEQQQIQDRTRSAIEGRRARLDAEEAKAKSLEPHEFWADKSTPQKAIGVFGSLLSGIGAAIQGKGAVNLADQQLDKIIDRDMALQKDRYQAQVAAIGRARQGVQDAGEMGAQEQEWFLARKVSVREKLLDESKQLLAAQGMNAAKIEGNGLVLAQQQKIQEDKLKLESALTKNVSSTVTRNSVSTSGGVDGMGGKGAPGDKPLTGPQSEAAAGVESIAIDLGKYRKLNVKWTDDDLKKIQNNTTFSDATQKTAEGGIGGALVAYGARALGVPRTPLDGLPPEKVQAYQALDRMRQQVLKAMTGAGVTNAEQVASKMNFLPAVGDSPAVMESKLRASADFARANAIRAGAMRPDLDAKISGLINFKQPEAPKQAAAASPAGGAQASAGGTRVKLRDGRVGTLHPDGTFEEG